MYLQAQNPVDSLPPIQQDTLMVIQNDTNTVVETPQDSLSEKDKRDPEKALLYSTLITGGGQVYNRQYWKAPIFAAAFGASLTQAVRYRRSYNRLNNAYLGRTANADTLDAYPNQTAADLQFLSFEEKEKYNVALLLTLTSYGFNLLDAYTSALSINTNKAHPPVKAAYYSAILPGLGQIYNGKGHRIKAPIIWAGLGFGGYCIYYTASRNRAFRKAYIYRNDPTQWNTAIVGTNTTDAVLLRNRERFLNYMELSIICTSLWYILNILDATVYAHLYGFDLEMDDDISLEVRPWVSPQWDQTWNIGMRAVVRF